MDKLTEQIYETLRNKYKKLMISKKELAQEIGCTMSTIDRYMKNNNISYKKIGNKAHCKVYFSLIEIAKFLAGRD